MHHFRELGKPTPRASHSTDVSLVGALRTGDVLRGTRRTVMRHVSQCTSTAADASFPLSLRAPGPTMPEAGTLNFALVSDHSLDANVSCWEISANVSLPPVRAPVGCRCAHRDKYRKSTRGIHGGPSTRTSQHEASRSESRSTAYPSCNGRQS